MFCIYLRTNSDLCLLQHKLIGFYNRDEKCLQRGTDWVFNYSSLRFVFKGLNLTFSLRTDTNPVPETSSFINYLFSFSQKTIDKVHKLYLNDSKRDRPSPTPCTTLPVCHKAWSHRLTILHGPGFRILVNKGNENQ